MMHLVKLELKKGNLARHIRGTLIACAIIIAVMLMMYFIKDSDSSGAVFKNQLDMLGGIDTLTRATFIIYASSLLSSLIIGEYKDNTMSLLFAYPISRKQLMFAKLSIVFVWCFFSIALTNLLTDALMLTIDSHFGYAGTPVSSGDLLLHAGSVLTQAVGAAGMSLLPLVIGLRRKSVSATIISSIFIVMIVASNNFGVSLSSIVAIPLSLAAIGVLGTYLSFRNIDRADVA
ncbi:ABC transporter permease [Saccharibacillus sp. CPCC 101409]|uniref:ABC transporter permease n=1 Tax=Saccharibacillus sp. CPCC 101409 TaxID=3058041 RepID=UPI0026734FD7|nr:ABC transporter permease [Saccharibacillus sp. CPCC 101409]MDO3409825.1 ABC transporter permease [Saccharibacillus sp. CPCC 101409]